MDIDGASPVSMSRVLPGHVTFAFGHRVNDSKTNRTAQKYDDDVAADQSQSTNASLLGTCDFARTDVCQFRTGSSRPPVALSNMTCFSAHNIRVFDLIGEGVNGAAYYSCFYNDCGAILKMGNVQASEYVIANDMGNLGIGPRIYLKTQCAAVQASNLRHHNQQQQAIQQSRRGASNRPFLFNLQLSNRVAAHATHTPAVDILVMERLDMTLADWLNRENVLTSEHAVMLHQLIAGAYQSGLIHMDLKTDNIMIRVGLTAYGQPFIVRFYLIDFGWSYYLPYHGVYNPLTHNGWPGTVPVNPYSPNAAVWDSLCVLADLQLLNYPDHQVGQCIMRFADILRTHYGVPDHILADAYTYLVHTAVVTHQAITIT